MKIVQAWHFQEEGLPADHYSTGTFQFKQESRKTQLTFTRQGISEHKAEELKPAWKQFYRMPMKAYLKTGVKQVSQIQLNV